MLSGRRKRDYEADSIGAQSADGSAPADGISPNEAAEVGVMTMADASTAESSESDAEDEVLVLA